MADPRRARIVHLLATGPTGASINTVAKRADVSFGLAKRTLEQLEGMGLLALSRRGFRYTLALTPLCRSILAGNDPDFTG